MHVPPHAPEPRATSVDDVLVMGGTTRPPQPSESRGRTTCCGTRARPSPLTPTVVQAPVAAASGATTVFRNRPTGADAVLDQRVRWGR